MQSGTVTVLSSAEDLKCLQDQRMQRQISILKNPKFWTDAAGRSILRTKFSDGRAKYAVEWGHLYNKDCTICKRKNLNVNECKHQNLCKIYVIKDEEGIVRVKRMNVNAKLPVRSSSGSAGYDLSAAETAVVPAHGKCLVKTGLAIAMPPGCYGRVAPRSGLAVKKFIDVGAGVIDSDYRGELGVVLFNFSNEDFCINMGDRIAQLVFEKIKTPEIKEVTELEGTDRGSKGYGSSGISAGINEDHSKSVTDQDIKTKSVNQNEAKLSQLAQARQIISARQIQKLAKEDHPIFLAIIRANEDPQEQMTRKDKRIHRRAARLAATHGLIEGQRRMMNKGTGPNTILFQLLNENVKFSMGSLSVTGNVWKN